MKIRFGKFGVRMFYNRMTKNKEWPPADWPPFGKYRTRLDLDVFSDGESTHQCDLYYAEEGSRNRKLLLDIHGGGYIAQTRKKNYGFASVFLDKGYDVAVLDYPLNDGVQDIIDQVRILAGQLAYLHNHAKDLDIEGDDWFLTGDSAGGHFALLLAEMFSDPLLAAKICDTDLSGIPLKGVLVNCPVYDFAKAIEDAPLNGKGKDALFGPSWKDEAYATLISPKTHIKCLKMPVFISTCRNDFLLAHSKILDADLKKTGNPPTFLCMESQKPQVTHVHNVNKISLKESCYVNSEMDRFMKKCD